MNWLKDDFVLTDDPARVDVQQTYELLRQTYCGVRRPLETVENMVQHSLCFALLKDGTQVGFARAVTDYTVFSWVADLVIDPKLRKAGLGKWMMSAIMEHPELRKTQFVLQTRDAHELYKRYGFSRNREMKRS